MYCFYYLYQYNSRTSFKKSCSYSYFVPISILPFCLTLGYSHRSLSDLYK